MIRTATQRTRFDRLHAVNTRAIDLTEALLLLSRADQRSFAPGARRPLSDSRRGHRDSAPLGRKAWRHYRDLRGDDPHHRIARAPTAADYEPRPRRRDPGQTCPKAAPSGSRAAFTTGVRCSPSRTPARSSAHRLLPPLPSRSFAAANAYAPTTQASASAWQSPRASPKRTTEPSPSPPAPPAGSASRCNYPPRHHTTADEVK